MSNDKSTPSPVEITPEDEKFKKFQKKVVKEILDDLEN